MWIVQEARFHLKITCYMTAATLYTMPLSMIVLNSRDDTKNMAPYFYVSPQLASKYTSPEKLTEMHW